MMFRAAYMAGVEVTTHAGFQVTTELCRQPRIPHPALCGFDQLSSSPPVEIISSFHLRITLSGLSNSSIKTHSSGHLAAV